MAPGTTTSGAMSGATSGATSAMKNIFKGERVRLRAMEKDDWKIIHEWDANTEDSQFAHEILFPRSSDTAREWAEREATREPDHDTFRFAIENHIGEFVGTINTFNCDLRNGTFSYGVAIRGAHRRKGYATEAIRLLLYYFFEERRYQKVNVLVYSFNEASITLHMRLGFQKEGHLRRMVYTRGEFHDHIIFGMTAEEFRVLRGD